MRFDLVKLIAETPIKKRVDKRIAELYEKQIQDAINNSEHYSSNSVKEYSDRVIKKNIRRLKEGGFCYIANKYALSLNH
jgi:hypothetical protein